MQEARENVLEHFRAPGSPPFAGAPLIPPTRPAPHTARCKATSFCRSATGAALPESSGQDVPSANVKNSAAAKSTLSKALLTDEKNSASAPGSPASARSRFNKQAAKAGEPSSSSPRLDRRWPGDVSVEELGALASEWSYRSSSPSWQAESAEWEFKLPSAGVAAFITWLVMIVGIDLGTTNSLIGAMDAGFPRAVLPMRRAGGAHAHPLCTFSRARRRRGGRLGCAGVASRVSILSIKRLMGRRVGAKWRAI